MKVFYTASFYGKSKYQEFFDMVLNAIKKTGVDFLSPEVGDYLSILKIQHSANIKSKKKLHYDAIRKGILWADTVIIEVSHEDFQLGHEVSLAIQSKKPVLCLSIHEDFSKKISSPYLFGAKYNAYNIDELVTDFINKYSKETLNERFNLFMSKRQLKNLGKAAKEKGLNNSEYLRMLIDKNS